MSDWCEIKMRDIFRPELGDMKELDILNRGAEWDRGTVRR